MNALRSLVVIKIGSQGLCGAKGGVDEQQIASLVAQLAILKQLGAHPILVTSGAIASAQLPEISPSPTSTLTLSQIKSALGQPLLMSLYVKAAQTHGMQVAQILLTHEDFKHKKRFLNLRNTLLGLVDFGIIPIINENDTISTKEISLGDNDQLATKVASALNAPLLIMLTQAPGLFDRDPKDPQATLISKVMPTDDLNFLSFGAKTAIGRGGMESKLSALRTLAQLGTSTILCSFKPMEQIAKAYQNFCSQSFSFGTHFVAAQSPNHSSLPRSLQQWILSSAKAGASLQIDRGATQALREHKSLLPIGIQSVQGTFQRGDVLSIFFKQQLIAQGITEYDSGDVDKIKGLHTDEWSKIIKRIHHSVVIHRDNLCLINL